MSRYQLRTYTLASREDLDHYKDVVYPRHLTSFPDHDIEPHGFWTSPDDDEPRLFILVSYPDGRDPGEIEQQYMHSPGFLRDVEGFDLSKICQVESLNLEPSTGSPLR